MRVSSSAFFAFAALTCAHAGGLFLGPIPVQFVSAGTELTLDLHRFCDASAEAKFEITNAGSPQATFDPKAFELRIAIPAEARGLIDLPFRVQDASGQKAGVLTLAVRAPADHAGKPPLAIFADHLTTNVLSIRLVGHPQLAEVSAVAELLDGSTTDLRDKRVRDGFEFSTAKLPAGTWVRVIAADREGGLSNVIRVPIGKTKTAPWADAVMYYALTDRFADGDSTNDHPVENPQVERAANYHGGDWRGIEEKITAGYFEKLGINTLWLAPLNRNPATAYRESPEPHRWYTGYHGYWPISPNEVEPHFGTSGALKSLVHTAHAHGIRVIADLVLHHVHEEHPWWKEHRDWFGSLDLPDGKKNLRLWDEQQFTTWFEPYLPTFNFGRADAVEALIDNSAWWANEFDLDGFRLDAVKHIPQTFWWKFRSAMREKVEGKRGRSLYLVGETFKDRAGIASFVGPNMLDGQFDFPLYDSIKDAFGSEKLGLDQLESSLASSEASFGKEALMSPLIGNHDKGRFMAYADGDLPDPSEPQESEVGWKHAPQVDDPANYAKIELAQAFLMAIDGVPMIYYGDEIAMSGAGDPDNRRDMRFGDQVSAPERKVLKNFEVLGRIRRAHPALRYGSRRTLVAEAEILGFVRAHLNDRLLCVFNRSGATMKRELAVGPELPDGAYVDTISGAKTRAQGGRMSVEVSPKSAAFFVRASTDRAAR